MATVWVFLRLAEPPGRCKLVGLAPLDPHYRTNAPGMVPGVEVLPLRLRAART